MLLLYDYYYQMPPIGLIKPITAPCETVVLKIHAFKSCHVDPN